MSSPNITIYPALATWNNQTWNASSGGPFRFEWESQGEPLESRTGNDKFPRQVFVTKQQGRGKIRVREPLIGTPLGTSSTLSMTIQGTTNTLVISMSSMILFSNSGEQEFEQEGACTLSMAYQSTDGQTNPF